jgi:hypothetical protein
MPPMPAAINSVPSSYMNSQFRHSLTHWLRVAEIAGFDLSQSAAIRAFAILSRSDVIHSMNGERPPSSW